MKKFKLTPSWITFLSLALFAGTILRLIYVNDMEYKEDEEYNFTQSQLIGTTQPWPWYGIPSGVYLVNPGMSIWVFTLLAKLFGIHQPTSLAHAVQLFALLGICLVIPFTLRFVADEEKRDWLWAYALAMVNPFLILYQRKLWPEPFLPFFTMLTLMGWWKRDQKWGAFLWGIIGACLGQIHMSGFFFGAALFLWTAVFGKRLKVKAQETRWKWWLIGSTLGALPLIPWLSYILQHPIHGSMSAGWNEIIQFKYWAFWITDALGLHLGNPLGLLRGPQLSQISDFIRYPILFEHATYLVGLAHLLTAFLAVWIFSRWLKSHRVSGTVSGTLSGSDFEIIGYNSETAFVQNSALWGCGILLTLTGVVIRRYYMTITFPLEFIFWVRMARTDTKLGQKLLTALWICEFLISAHFVGYIHVNQGSIDGDYGKAYHLIKNNH